MSARVDESYRYCHALARRTGSNFYYSFYVLPRAKRKAMYAIYAFMRHSDDLADGAANPAVALEGLRRWRSELERALGGAAAADPILPAVADVVRRYAIPARHFHELLDGTEADQTVTRYATFADLYQYCYRVASCVGLIVLPIFGYTDPAAVTRGEACGIAFQLTNILRDVKEDAALGRIYLPLEDLRRFGVSEDDLLQGRATPAVAALLRFEAQRAWEYYAQARPLVGLIQRDSRRTLGVMIDIYAGILAKIEQQQLAVFGERIRLSAAEKWGVVLKHLWR